MTPRLPSVLLSAPVDPVLNALAEDIGSGDLTATYFVPAAARASATMVAREPCVLAGGEVAQRAFQLLDPQAEVELLAQDGDRLMAGQALLRVSGQARTLLSAERTALNFVQRLSAVATLTRQFVDAVAGTGTVILDTRKTTPGLRGLEKAAVRAGGGSNHRMGLYDAVMVKDNHLLVPGMESLLAGAIARLRADHPSAKVELEADHLAQVESFLAVHGIDVILLDNMPVHAMRQAVALAKGTGVRLEASGGVRLETVRAIAATGIDFISVGALTHSAGSIDVGLDFER